MSGVVRSRPMPRQPKRDDIAVKIDARVYRKAKLVAAFRNVSIAELLSELLDKPVDREYRKMRSEMGDDEEA